MINITIYQAQDGRYIGVRMDGHAMYAKHGKDIVCAGVSALVINTVNSIEAFTEDVIRTEIQPDLVKIAVDEKDTSSEAQLLLRSLVLGLQGIQGQYGKRYVKIKFKRKQEV